MGEDHGRPHRSQSPPKDLRCSGNGWMLKGLILISILIVATDGGTVMGIRPSQFMPELTRDAFCLFLGGHGEIQPNSAIWGLDGGSHCGNSFADHRARTFSPVTDSDSELQQYSGGTPEWTTPSMEWTSPPQQQQHFQAVHDQFQAPSYDALVEYSSGSQRGDMCGCSSQGDAANRKRLCGICGVMDATRGVAEESEEGRWTLLSCRHCAQFLKSTVSLSTRCTYCRRYATYGRPGGCRRQAVHCKRHSTSSEESVVGTRCLNLGNHLVATELGLWGEGEGEGSWSGLVGAGERKPLPRQCLTEGCASTASFGPPGGHPTTCKGHSLVLHVDLVHRRRCMSPGCDKHPSFGLQTDGVARYCRQHKPYQCVDLKARKCQHSWGCSKRPSFGDTGDGIPKFCMMHKLPQHVNVRSRKCSREGCTRQPCFGGQDRVVRFCKTHRRQGDVDLVHARCGTEGCERTASYGLPYSQPRACSKHRLPGHVSYGTHPKLHAQHDEAGEQRLDKALRSRSCSSEGDSPSGSPSGLSETESEGNRPSSCSAVSESTGDASPHAWRCVREGAVTR